MKCFDLIGYSINGRFFGLWERCPICNVMHEYESDGNVCRDCWRLLE